MAELEARYESNPSYGWRRALTAEPVVLGRVPGDGGWSTEWDNFISRQHATLTWDGHALHVEDEHIAELRYVNCRDGSIPGLPARPWASVYVVLKPGIAWDVKTGTHQIDPP